MEVLIKNMKMPKTCDECLSGFVKTIGCNKRQFFDDRNVARHPDCPLVPVPPHGDLIDRDTLKKQGYFFPCAIGTEYAIPLRAVREAPIIIPAEEE